MKTVDINYISNYISYNFRDMENVHYYFDLTEFEIISIDELKSKYGFIDDMFSDKITLQYVYNIVPLATIDLDSEKRNYLHSLNNRKIDREIKSLDNNEFYIYFQKLWDTERAFLLRKWDEYEKQCCIKLAVEWCENYNIPYTKGDVYEHN
ncbi:MAG: hypothetical protein K2K66_00630 [Ruminococcus sp.]|nr:hypothetical protein [Ruminococcus sp.]